MNEGMVDKNENNEKRKKKKFKDAESLSFWWHKYIQDDEEKK